MRICTTSVLLFVFSTASVAFAGQEPFQKAKELYAAAAYEDALAVLTSIPEEARAPHIEQYRVFCLLALGEADRADDVIEEVLWEDPLYQPDPSEASPRMIQAFTDVRKRLLPAVVKRMYADSKAAHDRKNRQEAVDGFEKLLRVIDTVPSSDTTLGDLRVLANGFLELSRALPIAAPPDSPAAPPPVSEASGAPAAAADIEEITKPVILKQEIPRWVVPDAASRRLEFTGLIRVRVGVDGRVESSELIRRLHPAYDQLLMRAAKDWLYEPATKGGVPVPSDVVVEVRLRPQE